MSSSQQTSQNIVIMRHGDRRDYLDPSWAATAGDRKWDPPLAQPGLSRAFFTGQKLRDNLGFPIHRVFVSPFYRCLQTAAQAIAALTHQNDASNLKVKLFIFTFDSFLFFPIPCSCRSFKSRKIN